MAGKKDFYEVKRSDSELDPDYMEVHEILSRSHQAPIVDVDAPLEKKTKNKKILARLKEIEKYIINQAQEKGLLGKK